MNILVTIPFSQSQKEKIKRQSEGHDLTFIDTADLQEEQLAKADIIMGNLPIRKIKTAKNLKWLQLNTAGANRYCSTEVIGEGVVLTNSVGAFNKSVSENMLAYTMALFKKLYKYHDNQRSCLWHDEGHVISTEEAVIAVIGAGAIGTAYGKMMKALGSYVIGVRRRSTECPEGFDEMFKIDDIAKVLKRADLTMIVLPCTSETVGLFDETMLRCMKPGSYLVNVGRGKIVDTLALEKNMKEGYLSGAVLDVTEPEPLPSDHALWKTPNVWITPHIAGGFNIDATLEQISDICSENLTRYLNDEELINVVDRKNQY